jgi:hypothetical protein
MENVALSETSAETEASVIYPEPLILLPAGVHPVVALKVVPKENITSTLVPAIKSFNKSEYLFPAGVSGDCVSPSHAITLSLDIVHEYPVTIDTEAFPIVSFVKLVVVCVSAVGLKLWDVANAMDLPLTKIIKLRPLVI